MTPENLERYSRQVRFAPLGEAGQQRLLASAATLVGCGALGSVLAETLVRAGLGRLRIVDRDFLELSNLQRQVLFDEQDVAQGLPKAEAARRRLTRINSQVAVEAINEDANNTNIEALVSGADVILDGTDNFETRYLINDVACKRGIPWIYGACVSATGLVLPIIPGRTPCLKCVFDQPPPAEASPTCDTAGVIGPAVNVVAGLQAAEALKILSGNLQAVSRKLISLDLWANRIAGIELPGPVAGCACCGQGRYDYLDGEAGRSAVTMCGRNAVQINPARPEPIDLDALARKLAPLASAISRNPYMLQADVERYQITLFPSGRAIIKGTTEPQEARSVYARYVGA